MKKIKKRIEGFSLVETLITVVIVAVVMLIAGTTLSTLIRVSASSSIRTTVREEGEFVLELLRRTARNSHTDDIVVFDVENRFYDEANDATIDVGELKGYENPTTEGVSGTELHFRPSGFSRWVCIGYFQGLDSDLGYILKSSARDLGSDHSSCFDSSSEEYSQYTVVLNSSEVDINYLNAEYFRTQGDNILMTIDVELEPTRWVSRDQDEEPPRIFRQAVISTQKLTWE